MPRAASRLKWITIVVILLVMKSICYKLEWTGLCWEKTVKIPCAVQMTAVTKDATIHKYLRRKKRLSSVMVNKREKLVNLGE